MLETSATTLPQPTSTRRPALGFVGVGWIGRHRLDAIMRSGLADIAAIADPVKSAAEQASAAAPNAWIGEDFAALLERDLDGIVIATPSALHAAQATAALRSGKAVFCQKPLARTGPETAAVIAAARDADRLLGVDLSYRFTAGMQAIRALIRRGELGKIYAVETVFHNAYGPDKAWFYDAELSGGGCLLDLGIHLVDLVLWSLDFPAVENATGNIVQRDGAGSASRTVEDYAAGQLRLAGGTSVQLACSWKAPAGCDARIEVTFFGTQGGATFRNLDGSFYDFQAERFRSDRSRESLAAPPDNWGGRAAVDWVRRLAQSPAFDPEIAHLGTVATTLDRLYGRHL